MSWYRKSKTDPSIQQSIDYLDERFPFWLTKVLNIGEPVMDTSITSAAIAYDQETGDFTFRMNPEFAEQLTDEERAFLMSHEAMHVVRNDMAAHADPKYADKDALNLAMDAIINDTLTNAGLTAPEWAANGMRDVGFDCEGADLDDVYETIVAQSPPPPPEGGEGEGDEDGEPSDDEAGEGSGKGEATDDEAEGDESDGEPADGEGEGEGGEGSEDDADGGEDGSDGDGDGEGEGDEQDGDAEGNGDGAEGQGKPMAGGGHDDWSQQDGMSEAAAEQAEMYDEDRGDDDAGGHGQSDGSMKYVKPEGTVKPEDLPNLDYEALFRLVEPELVDGFGMGRPPRADWSRPRRSTMSLLPHTNLPSRKDDHRKLALASRRLELVVFLDNSGSVTPNDIALFREIAKLLPTARADYRFVVAGSTATEVTRQVMFDQDVMLPSPGAGASYRDAVDYANKGGRGDIRYGKDYTKSTVARRLGKEDAKLAAMGEDALRTAIRIREEGQGTVLRNEFGGQNPHQSFSMEFNSMQAWIKQALENGQLRNYPKSVLVISDCGSGLTNATEEEAARWTVLTNYDMRYSPGGAGTLPSKEVLRQGYRGPHRRARGSQECKIPVENFHYLQELVLAGTHVRKKGRV